MSAMTSARSVAMPSVATACPEEPRVGRGASGHGRFDEPDLPTGSPSWCTTRCVEPVVGSPLARSPQLEDASHAPRSHHACPAPRVQARRGGLRRRGGGHPSRVHRNPSTEAPSGQAGSMGAVLWRACGIEHRGLCAFHAPDVFDQTPPAWRPNPRAPSDHGALQCGCNPMAATAWWEHTANQSIWHMLVYQDIRTTCGLSAPMTVRAISKVAKAYQRGKTGRPTFHPHGSIIYD